MQLTNKITSAFLLLCLLLSFTFAKGVPDDWGKVKALKSGTSVVLITKQGAEYEGDAHLVTDDEIAVAVDDGSWRLARVKRVEVSEIRKRRSKFSRQVLGGAIGGGIGFGAGYALGSMHGPAADPAEVKGAAALTGFLGVFLGGITGAAFGPRVISAKGQMIYLAP